MNILNAQSISSLITLLVINIVFVALYILKKPLLIKRFLILNVVAIISLILSVLFRNTKGTSAIILNYIYLNLLMIFFVVGVSNMKKRDIFFIFALSAAVIALLIGLTQLDFQFNNFITKLLAIIAIIFSISFFIFLLLMIIAIVKDVRNYFQKRFN